MSSGNTPISEVDESNAVALMIHAFLMAQGLDDDQIDWLVKNQDGRWLSLVHPMQDALAALRTVADLSPKLHPQPVSPPHGL